MSRVTQIDALLRNGPETARFSLRLLRHALALSFEPVNHITCHDDAAGDDCARNGDCAEGDKQYSATLIGTAAESAHLLHIERHVPRADLALRIVDLGRARHVDARRERRSEARNDRAHRCLPRILRMRASGR